MENVPHRSTNWYAKVSLYCLPGVAGGSTRLLVMLLGAFPFDHTEHPDPNTSEAHQEVWLQQVRERGNRRKKDFFFFFFCVK